MIRYSVAGRSANTDATLDSVGAQLWNPATVKSIYVAEVHCVKPTATADHHKLIRSSAKGATPGSTVTADIDNDYNRAVAPPSGALLELANFTTEPTLQGPELARTNLPAAIGAGFIWVFGGDGIAVPQTTGLCVAVPEIGVEVAIIGSDFTFVWDE